MDTTEIPDTEQGDTEDPHVPGDLLDRSPRPPPRRPTSEPRHPLPMGRTHRLTR